MRVQSFATNLGEMLWQYGYMTVSQFTWRAAFEREKIGIRLRLLIAPHGSDEFLDDILHRPFSWYGQGHQCFVSV